MAAPGRLPCALCMPLAAWRLVCSNLLSERSVFPCACMARAERVPRGVVAVLSPADIKQWDRSSFCAAAASPPLLVYPQTKNPCTLVHKPLARASQAAWDVALFCLCGAVGQLFIFATIRRFGSLANTLVCTTRKFFNILLSVLLNGNPLLPQQWAAVALVFAGLLVSSLAKGGKRGRRTSVVKAGGPAGGPGSRAADIVASGRAAPDALLRTAHADKAE